MYPRSRGFGQEFHSRTHGYPMFGPCTPPHGLTFFFDWNTSNGCGMAYALMPGGDLFIIRFHVPCGVWGIAHCRHTHPSHCAGGTCKKFPHPCEAPSGLLYPAVSLSSKFDSVGFSFDAPLWSPETHHFHPLRFGPLVRHVIFAVEKRLKLVLAAPRPAPTQTIRQGPAGPAVGGRAAPQN